MLTNQDIDVLLEAVEAWETKDNAGRLMGDLFMSVLCRDEEQLAKMEKDREEQNRKFEAAQRVRKDRGTMLRAKLIQMRDSADADALLQSAGS